MAKASRDKGRRGQQQARELLTSRDWRPIELIGGQAVEDFIAIDTSGVTWSVEVKNTVAITVEHRKQAMRQAEKNRLPWMLLSHIAGTSSWLVQRKGEKPVVWTNKGD